MLTYNMDVEERSVWLRATPNSSVLAQPFYATEAGLFYGRAHFATARTDKESYILFYTLAGAGLIEQNDQHISLPEGTALLLDCPRCSNSCRSCRSGFAAFRWLGGNPGSASYRCTA